MKNKVRRFVGGGGEGHGPWTMDHRNPALLSATSVLQFPGIHEYSPG